MPDMYNVYYDVKTNKWMARISLQGKALNAPWRTTAEEAAADADRLIYMIKGPHAPNNGTLTEADKAALDGRNLEEVLAEIKATGGNAFSRGSSAYRGVSWNKGSGKWRAHIQNPQLGKKQMLGTFNTEQEAAMAYDAAAVRLHGSKARLNFPGHFTSVPDATEPTPVGILPPAAAAAAAAATAASHPLPHPLQAADAAAEDVSAAQARRPETAVQGFNAVPIEQLHRSANTAAPHSAALAVENQHSGQLQARSQQQQQQQQQSGACIAPDQHLHFPDLPDHEIPDWWEDSDDDLYADPITTSTTSDDWFATINAAVAAAQNKGLLQTTPSDHAAAAAASAAMPNSNLETASANVTAKQLAVVVHALAYDPNKHNAQHLQLVLAAAAAAVAAGRVGAAAAAAAKAAFGDDIDMQQIMTSVVAELYSKCSTSTAMQAVLAQITAAAAVAAAAAKKPTAAAASGPWRGRKAWKQYQRKKKLQQQQQQQQAQCKDAGTAAAMNQGTTTAAAAAAAAAVEMPPTAADNAADDKCTHNADQGSSSVATAVPSAVIKPAPVMLLPTAAARLAPAAVGGSSSSSSSEYFTDNAVYRAVSVGPLKALFVRPEAAAMIQQMVAGWKPIAGVDYESIDDDDQNDDHADGGSEWITDSGNDEDLDHDGKSTSNWAAIAAREIMEAANAAAATIAAAAAGASAAAAAGSSAPPADHTNPDLEQAALAAAQAAAAAPTDTALRAAAVTAAQAAAAVAVEEYDRDLYVMIKLCTDQKELEFLTETLQYLNYPGDKEVEVEVDDEDSAAAAAAAAAGADEVMHAAAAVGQTHDNDGSRATDNTTADAVMTDVTEQQQQQQGQDSGNPVAAAAAAAAATDGTSGIKPKKKVKQVVRTPVSQYLTVTHWAKVLNIFRQESSKLHQPLQQQQQGTAAAVPADEQQQHGHYFGLYNYSDISSEEEEEYEADWAAAKLAAVAAAATAAGSSAAGAFAAAAAAAGPSEKGSLVETLGISRQGWKPHADAPPDQAESRRSLKELVCGDFHRGQIPQLDVPLTGNMMKDTVSGLEAIIAEGDADHIPSHYRSWRIAQLVKRLCPSFPLQALSNLPRPAEGDYCPVMLRVPPPDPSTPTLAAAAAAEAAATHTPRLTDHFDPVNRLPPQVVSLYGCSYRGQKAVARRATAAAAAAAAAAGDALGARKLVTAGAEPLVKILKPMGWRDAMRPGAGWPDTAAAAAAGSSGSPGYHIDLAAAAAAVGMVETMQQDHSSSDDQGGISNEQGAGFVFSATPPAAATPPPPAAAAAAAVTRQPTPVPAPGAAPAAAAGSSARRKLIAHRNRPATHTHTTAAAAAAAATIHGTAAASSSSSRYSASQHKPTPNNAEDDDESEYVKAYTAYVLSDEYDPFTAPFPTSTKAALAAARAATAQAAAAEAAAAAAQHAAPVFTAHPEVYNIAEQHLEALNPQMCSIAATAANAAAAALLEPEDMEVDWVYDLDLGGRGDPGFLWDPARDRVLERYKEAKEAAKQGTAAAAAPAAAGGGAQRPNVIAGSSSSSGDAEHLLPMHLRNDMGPDWGSVVTGFIKADLCPNISAMKEQLTGQRLPRPIAIPHTFHPNTPAAAAAAKFAAANTSSSSNRQQSYAAAGSDQDRTRISFGKIERQQWIKADQSRSKIDQILLKWQQDDPEGYVIMRDHGAEGYVTWCNEREAERAAFWAAADATAAAAGGERVPEELMKPWGKVVVGASGRIIAAAAAAGSTEQQQQQEVTVDEAQPGHEQVEEMGDQLQHTLNLSAERAQQ